MLLDIEFEFGAPLFQFVILLYCEFGKIFILFDQAIFIECVFYHKQQFIVVPGLRYVTVGATPVDGAYCRLNICIAR